MKPRARTEGLVVRELPDELLVYDLERHRAHCLNPTAALVFKHCDGRRSVAQIARILRRELDVDAPADESLVWLSLYATALGVLAERMTRPLVRRALEGVTGVLLVGFGVRLLVR